VAQSGTGDGSGRQDEAPGASAAARVRTSGADFSSSFSKLEDVISRACARHTDWEARIAGGIQAALEFAAACPAAANALTLQARRADRDGHREEEVIAYFTELLAEAAPPQKLFPICTDEAIVESIATVVRGSLLRGDADQLPNVAPDLIYLALVPYAGISEARRWTELFMPVSSVGGT